jgi:hypothetical protein
MCQICHRTRPDNPENRAKIGPYTIAGMLVTTLVITELLTLEAVITVITKL